MRPIGVGIERLDYTKGIPDRIRGLDFLFQNHPEYRGRLRFIQVAVPSRMHVPAYQQIDREVDEAVKEINARWRSGSWEPVTYIKSHQGPADMMALHRLSRFCIVSSLHDGMNLVAKEYIASRTTDGVLILSRFTGSARELSDALLINPFAIEETAEAIHRALTMPEDERRRKMQRMRAHVSRSNVYRWAGRILSSLLKFDLPEGERADDDPLLNGRATGNRGPDRQVGLDPPRARFRRDARPLADLVPRMSLSPNRSARSSPGLAGSERVTAMIVSGRSLQDVAGKVGLPGLIYAGNHGLEIEGPGLKFVEPTAAATVQRLEGVTEGIADPACGAARRAGGTEGADH